MSEKTYDEIITEIAKDILDIFGDNWSRDAVAMYIGRYGWADLDLENGAPEGYISDIEEKVKEIEH